MNINFAKKIFDGFQDDKKNYSTVDIPCKVGDTIYFVYGEVRTGIISEIRIGENYTRIKVNFSSGKHLLPYIFFDINDLGEKYFLNKSEAENKLKLINQDNDI